MADIDPDIDITDQPLPELDDFTRGYLEAALWTSDPDPGQGEWSERDDWCIARIDREDLARAVEVCQDFQKAQNEDLTRVVVVFGATEARNGHDFWLTRNGHGAGFWDRGYGEAGDRLTKASHPYGEAYMYGPETEDNGGCTDEAWEAWLAEGGVIHLQD